MYAGTYVVLIVFSFYDPGVKLLLYPGAFALTATP
jgi:hypothetical protein